MKNLLELCSKLSFFICTIVSKFALSTRKYLALKIGAGSLEDVSGRSWLYAKDKPLDQCTRLGPFGYLPIIR